MSFQLTSRPRMADIYVWEGGACMIFLSQNFFADSLFQIFDVQPIHIAIAPRNSRHPYTCYRTRACFDCEYFTHWPNYPTLITYLYRYPGLVSLRPRSERLAILVHLLKTILQPCPNFVTLRLGLDQFQSLPSHRFNNFFQAKSKLAFSFLVFSSWFQVGFTSGELSFKQVTFLSHSSRCAQYLLSFVGFFL